MSSLDSGLVRYIEAVNNLELSQVTSLAEMVLAFLLAPSTTNFQEEIAQFAASNQ